jgi:hypothetical protein
MIFENKGGYSNLAQQIEHLITPYAYREFDKYRMSGLNIRQCMAKISLNMPNEVIAMITQKELDTLEVHCIWMGTVEGVGLDKIIGNEGW